MAYDDYDLVEVTFDGNVAILSMNQPERLNPTNPANSEIQIRDALRELENDPKVRAVVFTGKGRAFSAGGDQGGGPPPDPRVAVQQGSGSTAGRFLYGPIPGGPAIAGGSMWLYMHKFRKPMIGAVKGYALGGGWELAETCDILVAGETCRFGSIEIRLGQYPYGLGSQYLSKTVGKHRAAWLMMTGEMIDARTALEWGLVNQVVPDDQVLPTALEIAHTIASHAPLPIGMIKYMIDKAIDVAEHYDLERALAYHLGPTEDNKKARDYYRESRQNPDATPPDYGMR